MQVADGVCFGSWVVRWGRVAWRRPTSCRVGLVMVGVNVFEGSFRIEKIIYGRIDS